MASTNLYRTMGSATNRYKATFSFWIKKNANGLSATQMILNSWNSTNYRFQIYFQGGTNADRLALYNVDNGSANMYFETNAKYRDINAWYHIYIAVDTTLSTQGDRLKFYVNGERITSFAQETYPAQNADMSLGASSYILNIGRYGGGGENFDGSMSYFYYVDGSVIDVTQFGSTDSTTGEWKINTSPTISSYGNQGFLILKDGDTITDQSPNSNNLQVGNGTLTKTEDCPSNVFCTLSTLHKLGTNTGTYSNGNTKYADANSNWQGTMCTLGTTSGKYYWEYQLVGGAYHMVGIMPDNVNLTSSSVFDTIGGYSAYVDNGTIKARFNGSDISGWNEAGMGNTTFSANDYINLAVDMDNKFMYIGKNGTWFKSGDPTSGATGTGGINVSATFTSGVFMIPVISAYNGTTGQFNFGNGYMGTTAVSSAGTNASNNGIFEYDVPSGYTALSTKGLNL